MQADLPVHWNMDDLTPEQVATLDDELVARIKAREAIERQVKAEASGDSTEDDADLMEQFVSAPCEQWDCESVLTRQSDYSRQPGCIQEETKRFLRRPHGTTDRSAVQLSAKTGLPLGVPGVTRMRGHHTEGDGIARGAQEASDRHETVNLGEARGRGEATEDRKVRKAVVKDAKRAARQSKKLLKRTYAQEHTRAQQHSAANKSANASVLCMS
jgi:protein LTV1